MRSRDLEVGGLGWPVIPCGGLDRGDLMALGMDRHGNGEAQDRQDGEN